MAQMAWTFPAGYLEDNFDDSATVDQTGAAKNVDVTVPAGKEVMLLGGKFKSGQAQNVSIAILNSDDKVIDVLMPSFAQTATVEHPLVIQQGSHPQQAFPRILKGGDYVRISFLGSVTSANEIAVIWKEVGVSQ